MSSILRGKTLSPSQTLDTLRLVGEDVGKVQNLPPSYLPCLDARPKGDSSWQSTEVPFKDIFRLESFCSEHNVSSESVLQAAWALVLRCYIGNPSVCFMFQSSKGNTNDVDAMVSDPIKSICVVEIEGVAPAIETIMRMKKHRRRGRSRSMSAHSQDSLSLEDIPGNTGLFIRDDDNPGDVSNNANDHFVS